MNMAKRSAAAEVAKVLLKAWREERVAIIQEFREALWLADAEMDKARAKAERAIRASRQRADAIRDLRLELLALRAEESRLRSELLKRGRELNSEFTEVIRTAVAANVDSALDAATKRAVERLKFIFPAAPVGTCEAFADHVRGKRGG